MAKTFARGVRRLLVEGGSTVHTLFLEAGLVDDLRLAIAPFFVGDEKAPRFVHAGHFPHAKDHPMSLQGLERLGDVTVMPVA